MHWVARVLMMLNTSLGRRMHRYMQGAARRSIDSKHTQAHLYGAAGLDADGGGEGQVCVQHLLVAGAKHTAQHAGGI